MKKTSLVIMAAGMGSRFGGPKQITPVGPSGEKIIDYSVFDAKRAGFDEVIFIVNEKIKKDFTEAVGNKISKHFPVKYVIQDINDMPKGFSVPEGRTKPWGTGHAVLSCIDEIDAPFMVINADDYYGTECFKVLHDFLVNINNSNKLQLAMAGYKLKNTITDAGSVSRGICSVDENGMLTTVTERTDIVKKQDGIFFTEDGGATYTKLPDSAVTSLNCWAFDDNIMAEFKSQFIDFLKNGLSNPLKSEYFLPSVVNNLVKSEKAEVKVLTTDDKWYGMTYAEDRKSVQDAISEMILNGVYPKCLWE